MKLQELKLPYFWQNHVAMVKNALDGSLTDRLKLAELSVDDGQNKQVKLIKERFAETMPQATLKKIVQI